MGGEQEVLREALETLPDMLRNGAVPFVTAVPGTAAAAKATTSHRCLSESFPMAFHQKSKARGKKMVSRIVKLSAETVTVHLTGALGESINGTEGIRFTGGVQRLSLAQKIG